MGLRRDPSLSGGVRNPNPDRPAVQAMANEQPVTKRQRIESKNVLAEEKTAPPDIIASPQAINGGSESSSSSSSPSVSLTHPCTPEITTPCSGDEIDNVSRRLIDEDARISPSFPDLLKVTPVDGDLVEIQSHLAQQCLCGVSERVLRRLFQPEAEKRGAALKEWPPVKTMQFLSNIQLLFDVYLPQNVKGFICRGVVKASDVLLRQEITLVDEVTELCDHDNRFVRFLAGRVMASFLLVAMKRMHVAGEKLKPIVENLKTLQRMDEVTMRRVAVSADILRRIVEWKNTEEHPLDEREDEDDDEQMPPPLPPIENNYFAIHYNPEMVAAAVASSSSAGRRPGRQIVRETESGCRQMRLTDSESFDPGSLKQMMIEALRDEWDGIVESLAAVMRAWRGIAGAEQCILAVLGFWESVISVHANLPIDETLRFREPLVKLQKLLSPHLPATVYRQMLGLFNEALCYGSTLALQDFPPKAECDLATQVVRQVRSRVLLRSLPQDCQGESARGLQENPVTFIGQHGENVVYEGLESRVIRREGIVDRSLLQKFVLLVLKSVAMTAKQVRSDSSDSSMDSTSSTEFQADQDMREIERSIRDALGKLADFIKNTLSFHPETHFSKILIHLFADQDDYLLEAMLCTLDVTANISFRNKDFPELVAMLNPIFTFVEFLEVISYSYMPLLDFLLGNETCFLCYLLRFLKYIRRNWELFQSSCQDSSIGSRCLERTMDVLIQLRHKIQQLVASGRFPYRIDPILMLMETCEAFYAGDEFS
ncbi:protein lines [Phlebotomus argentipes]|uniref:protein lines n=1 Tax=Phlebotomus argentipes TaxID=94469 RepID=UPI0028929E65|nr:protein lines [Phlebotomus argentipes]